MAGDVIVAQRQKHYAATLGASRSKRRLDGRGVVGDAVTFCQVRLVLRVHIAEGKIQIGQANRGRADGCGGD